MDDNLAGLRWKNPVVAATTTNGTLATAFENGDTIDGVALTTGDRILLKDQTTQTENGIYTVNASGAPTRATDADSTVELNSATVFVMGGTVNADRAYTQTTNNVTIGTHNIVWVQFGGGGSTYTADGQGIELSGSEFQLELNGATLSKSASGLKINDAYAGNGLTVSSDVLAVNTGTGLEISSDAVRIAAHSGNGLTGGAGSPLAIDTAVVARKSSGSIGDGSTTSIAYTHSLGTKDVHVSLRLNSDDSFIYADVVATSTTQVTVTFATAPATNAVRITVIG